MCPHTAPWAAAKCFLTQCHIHMCSASVSCKQVQNQLLPLWFISVQRSVENVPVCQWCYRNIWNKIRDRFVGLEDKEYLEEESWPSFLPGGKLFHYLEIETARRSTSKVSCLFTCHRLAVRDRPWKSCSAALLFPLGVLSLPRPPLGLDRNFLHWSDAEECKGGRTSGVEGVMTTPICRLLPALAVSNACLSFNFRAVLAVNVSGFIINNTEKETLLSSSMNCSNQFYFLPPITGED